MEDVKLNLPEVDPDVLLLLLANNISNLPEQIDRLFKFAKIEFEMLDKKAFTAYRITPSENRVRLTCYRTIEPRCSIRYDIPTDKYYNFKSNNKMTEAKKNIIKSEMRLIIDDYVNNLKKNIRKIL